MTRIRVVIFLSTVIALAELAGCTTPSALELPLCGPKPGPAVAYRAAQDFVHAAGFAYPDAAYIGGIVVHGPGKLYKGLVSGGGYWYGWWVTFPLGLQTVTGARTPACKTTILVRADGTIHWDNSARDCL